MTITDILSAPEDQELVFEREKLDDLLASISPISLGLDLQKLSKAYRIRMSPTRRFNVNPQELSEGEFVGYAIGRKWYADYCK